MSYSSLEDLVDSLKNAERTTQGVVKVSPEQMTHGRQMLRSWLGKYFRVVITDGRILVGVLSCTDKDANIVLAGCVEYVTMDGEPRILGNVMVPGKHIRSVEVEQRPTDEAVAPPLPQTEAPPEDSSKEVNIKTDKQCETDKPDDSKTDLAQSTSEAEESEEPETKSETTPSAAAE